MMKSQKVSIVMPVYNRADLVVKSINSVLKQTYQNLELLLIDDGSTDNTKEVVKSIDDERLLYVYQENSGACVARNLGLKLCSGTYVMFMDSDDFMEKNKIAIQIEAMERDNTPCAICDFAYHDEEYNLIRVEYNNQNLQEKILEFKSPFIMTLLMRRNSIPDTLKWNKSILRNQDMDFLFRYFTLIERWSYTPGAYCKYIQHGNERISNSYNMGTQYDELKESMRNFFRSSYSLIPLQNRFIEQSYIDKLNELEIQKFSVRFGSLFNQIMHLKSQKLKYVIYGFGSTGKTIYALLEDQKVVFIDRNMDVVNTDTEGCLVYGVNDLDSIDFDRIIVSVLGRERQVLDLLVSRFKIDRNKIITFDV